MLEPSPTRCQRDYKVALGPTVVRLQAETSETELSDMSNAAMPPIAQNLGK